MAGIEGEKPFFREEEPLDDRNGQDSIPPRELSQAEYLQLHGLREHLAETWRFSSQEEAYQLARVTLQPPYEQVIATIQEQPERVRERLQELRNQRGVVQNQRIILPPPYFVTAAYVWEELRSRYHSRAVSALQKGDDLSFLTYFDGADGVEAGVGRLFFGVIEPRSETQKRVKRAKAKIDEFSASPMTPDEVQLASSDIHTQMTRVKLLLLRDPSGITVVNEALARLRAEAQGQQFRVPRVTPWQTPGIVLSGAEFGAEVYKAVYPLAKQLKL